MDKELSKFFDVDERRDEVRLTIGAEIFIERVSAEPGDKASAEVLRCEALDISANGMQVVVDGNLTAGGIHTLIVELYRSEEVFRLISAVKWVRTHSDGYVVGLA